MKSLPLLLVLALAVAPASAAPIKLRDGGRERAYEIETSEVAVRGSDGRLELRDSRGTGTATASRGTPATEPDGFPVFYPQKGPRTEFTRRVATGRAVIELLPGADLDGIASAAGAAVVRRANDPVGPHVLSLPDRPARVLEGVARIAAMPGVRAARPLLARKMAPRAVPDDPYFASQWHLQNLGANNAAAGVDLDVVSAWDKRQGNGLHLAIVDDGVLLAHPDLSANIDTAIDRNWNAGTVTDGSAPSTGRDKHGTACAGVAGARGNNDLGVAGVAPLVRLVSLRLIADLFSDLEEAEAFGWENGVIDVKSNSWGPAHAFVGPDELGAAALADAAANGRGGLGTIFTWAAGNSGEEGDNANYDGYANSIYTIAVGAVTDQGEPTEYTEPGANVVVSAPSSSAVRQGIATTDLRANQGYNPDSYYPNGFPEFSNRDYTSTFGGTSAACPMVAGVVALVLEANPGLGWRDVQEILIRTARPLRPSDPLWETNGAGIAFHDSCGAGLVDARAAVRLATRWKNLPAWQSRTKTASGFPRSIPDDDPTGIEVAFDFSDAPDFRVEHVTVSAQFAHPEMSDLDVKLISPSGMESLLADAPHEPESTLDWTFSSVRHWGETAAGTWRLRVRDLAGRDVGRLDAASVTICGAAFDTSAATPPDNDLFARARPLATGPDGDAGSNRDGGREPGEPDHAGLADPDGRSVWWTWIAPETGTARAETAGSGTDTVLAVYTGNSVDALVPVASNDDLAAPTDLASAATFACVAGSTYRIAVAGFDGATGAIHVAARVLGLAVGLAGDLAFGRVAAGVRATRELAVTNTGDGPLSVTSVSLPPAFEIDWAGPFDLEPGLSRTFTLSFQPEAVGIESGDVTFTSTAVEGSGSLPISGEGFLDPELFKGSYAALIASATSPERGLAKLSLSKKSAFSASFQLGGATWRLRGVLDADGRFVARIARRNASPLDVEVRLRPDGVFEGALDDGLDEFTFLGERSPFTSKNPAPEEGGYTAVFDPDPPVPELPSGSGWATVKVAKAGTARMVGALGDGGKLSFGGALDAGGRMPIFVPLRKATGSISGVIAFRDLAAASDFDGLVRWRRAADPASVRYPNGFDGTVSAVGSRYVKQFPAASFGLNSASPPATWAATGGGLGSPLIKPVDFSKGTPKAMPGDPDRFTISANAGTGAVSGQFRPPGQAKSARFGGVILQKTSESRGIFTHASGDGAFELFP